MTQPNFILAVATCRFIEATVRGLDAAQPPCVRISAVRAVCGFCDHLTGIISGGSLQNMTIYAILKKVNMCCFMPVWKSPGNIP